MLSTSEEVFLLPYTSDSNLRFSFGQKRPQTAFALFCGWLPLRALKSPANRLTAARVRFQERKGRK